jgi:ribose 5-phosphate isomerase B
LKIAIGSDHAGYLLKEKVKKYLKKKEIPFTDFGTFKEESVDYPEYAYKVGTSIINDEADMGILFCDTGIGMCITANKIKGIRAANPYNKASAELSRLHNNSNVLCLGARTLSDDQINEVLETWLFTSFEGGRHETRLSLINKLTGL